jgi:hypothetical protein
VRFQAIKATSMNRQPSGIRRRVVSESRPTFLEVRKKNKIDVTFQAITVNLMHFLEYDVFNVVFPLSWENNECTL